MAQNGLQARARRLAKRWLLRAVPKSGAEPPAGASNRLVVDSRLDDRFGLDRHVDARLGFVPLGLDVKLTEVLRVLLIDGQRSQLTRSLENGIPVVHAPLTASRLDDVIELIEAAASSRLVILDLHDRGHDVVELSWPVWRVITARRMEVLYLKLQMHDARAYAGINLLPRRVRILSMPLLLGGSRFHVTPQDDWEGANLFRKTHEPNPNPRYRWNWTWIGAPTSKSRIAILNQLGPLEGDRGHFVVTQPGQMDAKNATVSYSEDLDDLRSSKVVLSLNGNGPWRLKDGGRLAKHRFVLRQDDPTLGLNPLSPRDGLHWVVAPEALFVQKLKHYIREDGEREKIRRTGHEWFGRVLFDGLWAGAYVDRLMAFWDSPKKRALEPFVVA